MSYAARAKSLSDKSFQNGRYYYELAILPALLGIFGG